MAVNESVYGAKSSWSGTNFKYANFGNNATTLNDGFTNNKLTPNKALDNSVVHSALGSESVLSHLHYYGALQEYATDNFNALLFTFATGSDDISNRRSSLNVTSSTVTLHDGMITPETKLGTGLNSVSPVIDFDYKRLRAVIKVHVSANKNDYTSGSVKEYTLKEYIDSHTTEYPYIRDAILELYNVENAVASEINGTSAKGLIIYNTVSLYKAFKSTATSYYEECNTGLMYCCYNNLGTRNFNKIIIYGLLNYDPDATSHIYHINKNYVGVFSDGVTIESDSTYTYCFKEYYTGFEEYIKHQTACFGIQFVTDTEYLTIDLENPETTDAEAENVYIGVLDDNFVGHGDFVNGKKIKNTKQYGLNSANDSPFDPSKETDPNNYYDTSIKPINVDGNTSFTTKYVLNYGQLNSIAEDFYKALNTKPEDLSYSEYSNSLFLTNNAIDTVVSCKYFPFQLPMTGGENVKMGNYTIKVGNEPLIAPVTSRKVSIYEFECGSCYGEFGDFRDFEPYTTYELKVPFCGSVRLNASECVGKSITVSLAVDLESGSCTAFVYAGDKLVESVSGSCGVDIPISGVQQATLDSQIFNASINQRQAKTNAVLSVAKGTINVGAGAYALSKAKTPRQIGTSSSYLARGITDSIQDISNSMYNTERANYNISHVEIPYKCVGAVSSGVCLSESLLCSLIKETPVMLEDYNPDVYAKTIGFACCKSGKIGSESGMVVCSDVRIENCSLTKTEKDMIVQLCKTGIIV